MAAPSLSSCRTFLKLKSVEGDTLLTTFLKAAEGTLGQLCGPLQPETVVEQTHAFGGTFLVDRWPLVEVTGIVDDDGNAVPLTGIKLDKRTGVVRLRGLSDGPIEVTYTAGYDPCPDDLETAVYVVVGHLWDTQRGKSGSFTQIHGMNDDAPVGAEASMQVLQGFALPRRAMELTRPYVKPGFA